MTKLDEFTLNVLCNPEVIEVDQDPLGEQGHPVIQRDDDTEVWTKPMEDGSVAVGLFNRADAEKARLRCVGATLRTGGKHLNLCTALDNPWMVAGSGERPRPEELPRHGDAHRSCTSAQQLPGVVPAERCHSWRSGSDSHRNTNLLRRASQEGRSRFVRPGGAGQSAYGFASPGEHAPRGTTTGSPIVDGLIHQACSTGAWRAQT